MATLEDAAQIASAPDEVTEGALREAILDGWPACAPPRLTGRDVHTH